MATFRSFGARSMALGVLAIGLAVGSTAQAQFTGGAAGGNTGLPPSGGEINATIPDVTVPPSSPFELQLLLDDPTPIPGFMFVADTDPMFVQFLSVTQGDGTLEYLNVNGQPPQCDLIADPMSVFGFMMYGIPYESSVYGTELLVITAVSPPLEGTYTINFMFEAMGMGSASGEVTITVGETAPPEEDKFERGDVNNDGACNLGDPIALLGHLFAGGAAPNCYDAADVDDDGNVGIADAVNLLAAVFGTGFEMDETCKADLTEDDLGACDRGSCAP